MIARLLISQALEKRKNEIGKFLAAHFSDEDLDFQKHPDLLYFPADSKLGIEQAKIIKEHFSLKPYLAKGRAIVLEDASNLTIEAQNALLKILEEPPASGILILAASSESKFLPTILSRCQVIRIKGEGERGKVGKEKEIELLLSASLEERFGYIEKLKEKEEFLLSLILYFHQNLPSHTKDRNFLNELLQAEAWANQNGNMRAILEYLMLVMPTKE